MMNLSKREKYFVSTALCAVAIFCLLHFIIIPFFEKRERLERGCRAKEKVFEEISALSAEYQAYEKRSLGIRSIIERREKGFTLFSFLEKTAGDTTVKDHIKYMKPSEPQSTGLYKETMVEIKLEGITLKQLVDYLYHVELSENAICLKRISIKENKGETGYIDAVLQVVTFRLA
jgi:general secretion pathway protein M